MKTKLEFRCSCGQAFNSKHRLTNHIGYAILLNDNKDNHQEAKSNRA